MHVEPNIETKITQSEETRGLGHDAVVAAVQGAAAGAGGVVVSKVANLLNRPKEAEPQTPQVILPPGVDQE